MGYDLQESFYSTILPPLLVSMVLLAFTSILIHWIAVSSFLHQETNEKQQRSIFEQVDFWSSILFQVVHNATYEGHKHKPKVVLHYGNTEYPDRCFVRIFKKYRALCPIDCKNNAFYLTPLTKPSDTCWFSCVPLGRNKLSNAVA